MIRIADLGELTGDAYKQHRNTWFAALLAAFVGGWLGTTMVIALLWLFTPCVG